MKKQEDWIIEYLREAIVEVEKTTEYLIESGNYTACNTDLSKSKAVMNAIIERLNNEAKNN